MIKKSLIDMTDEELREEKNRLLNGGELPHNVETRKERIKTIEWILDGRGQFARSGIK